MKATDWNVLEPAAQLHQSALVWDMVLPFFDYYLLTLSMDGELAGRFDPKYKILDQFTAAGCDCVGLTVGGSLTNIAITMKFLASNHAFFAAHRDRYVVVDKAQDIARAKKENKLAVVMNFQGSDTLEGNPDMVEIYYKLGIRSMLLTYNIRNAAGSGCHERSDDGLSSFGIRVVREMNRVGMLVDASHTGYRSTMDIFDASEAPVVFTHSNPAGLVEHPRNIKDEQLRACAATGGVVGVVGFDGFLPGKVATVQSVANAIEYLVDKIGADHVGLGLDWMYAGKMFKEVLAVNRTAYPQGKTGDYDTAADFLPPSALPALTEELMARGYAENHVRGILGENWLRVATQVWK